QISCMDPGWVAAEFSRRLRRGNAHAAEKWMQRNLNPRSKPCHHALLIQWDDLHLRIRKIFRQKSATGSEPVISVGNCQPDRSNADLQDIARLRVLDIDRTGKN